MDGNVPMRARIMAAASAALVEEGPQASMSTIAKRAGVATGSLYNHFDSKDALVIAIYETLGQKMRAALVPDAPAATAPERFRAYVLDYIAFIWSDPDRAILFEILSNVPLAPREHLVSSFADCSHYIHGVCAELIGNDPARDPAVTAAFIGGAIRNALKWRRMLDRDLSDDDARRLLEMCQGAAGGL